MGERRLRDRPAGEYRLAAGPELQQETDGGIDRSEVRDSPWNPLAGNRSRDCLELASRKPSWPAAKSDRINRPDIWMQAIRSDHQELLQHGGRPHMDSGLARKGLAPRNDESKNFLSRFSGRRRRPRRHHSSNIGGERNALPRVEVGLQRFDFFLHQPHGVAAEQQMRRRIGGQGNFQHRLCGLFGIANLPTAQFHPAVADRFDDGVVIPDRSSRPYHRSSSPVGSEAARLDRGDLDAEVFDFLAKGFGYPLERELAAMIVAEARQGDDPAHRGDVENMPGASLAHGGQHRLDHRYRAEYVDLELAPQVVD